MATKGVITEPQKPARAKHQPSALAARTQCVLSRPAKEFVYGEPRHSMCTARTGLHWQFVIPRTAPPTFSIRRRWALAVLIAWIVLMLLGIPAAAYIL